jgi:hypothetical protein
MLKSPLVAGKCPRSLAGIDVSSGAVTSLVSGVAHSERLTVGDDDTGVMQEPVQDAGGGGVLGQKPAPLLEGPMGGYGQGAAFVGGGHKPEQQLGAGVIERGEPDLIDLCRYRDRSTNWGICRYPTRPLRRCFRLSRNDI